VDSLTHALASYSLVRAAFPRLPVRAQIAAIAGGTLADVDAVSYYFGPAAYLRFHRTYLHSLSGAVLLAIICALICALIAACSLRQFAAGPLLKPLILATLAAAFLHIALDLCQPYPVSLLWPFSARRFQFDLLARFDLWLLLFLLAGVLLPLLASLVTQEIGVRSKSPRGRVGAALALSAVFLYTAVRVFLHAEAVTLLDSRTYRGEVPQHVAAFPDSTSPFLWHGVVETTSALHTLDLIVGPGNRFDPESATTSYKPEPSPALDSALRATSARLFLSVARFPKASVGKSHTGFHIELRDFAHTSNALSGPFPIAIIDTDPSARVLSDHLVWP
jgi:membrane-bound metal-dependent hydrolase YbcI (DUF457 family)